MSNVVKRPQVVSEVPRKWFNLKNCEIIDAKIDAEKVRNIEETSMRTWSYLLKIFEFAFHKNKFLFEKGECTEPM